MLNLLQTEKFTLAPLLSDVLIDRLRNAGSRVRYTDRQLIQNRGDQSLQFTLVESGQVLAGNIGEDGVFFTTALFNPGEYFGEFSLLVGHPRTQSLWAIGDTEVVHIKERAFRQLYESEPTLSHAILDITLRRLHFVVEFLDGQKRWPLTVRIVHLLLTSLDGDKEERRSQEVHCRQEDLANMLGISRVAVGKALKALEAEKLIATHYGSIVISDISSLDSWFHEHQQLQSITPRKPPAVQP